MRFLIFIFIFMSCLIGCATSPSGEYAPLTGNARRLMQRPDSKQARDCARDWVKDALYTVDMLEEQLKLEKVR